MTMMNRLPLHIFVFLLSAWPRSTQSLLPSVIRPSRFLTTSTFLNMAPGDNRRGGGGRRGADRSRRPRAPPPPMPPPGATGRGCFRDLIKIGGDVFVVKKDDQRTGVTTRGIISRLLTKSSYHPRGIKVMLTSGEVGRVTKLISDEKLESN